MKASYPGREVGTAEEDGEDEPEGVGQGEDGHDAVGPVLVGRDPGRDPEGERRDDEEEGQQDPRVPRERLEEEEHAPAERGRRGLQTKSKFNYIFYKFETVGKRFQNGKTNETVLNGK